MACKFRWGGPEYLAGASIIDWPEAKNPFYAGYASSRVTGKMRVVVGHLDCICKINEKKIERIISLPIICFTVGPCPLTVGARKDGVIGVSTIAAIQVRKSTGFSGIE